MRKTTPLAAYAQFAGSASADASDAAKLFGNRAAALASWPDAAIEDAGAAVSADVTYARGWFRLAAALVEAGDPLATDAARRPGAATGPALLFEARPRTRSATKPGDDGRRRRGARAR